MSCPTRRAARVSCRTRPLSASPFSQVNFPRRALWKFDDGRFDRAPPSFEIQITLPSSFATIAGGFDSRDGLVDGANARDNSTISCRMTGNHEVLLFG